MRHSLTNLVRRFSVRSRERRGRWFRDQFEINPSTKILDLGSESGANINFVLRGSDFDPRNVYIADIDSDAVGSGADEYGFNAVLLDESGELPFDNDFFDVVYCSSVIEHVTVPKSELNRITDGAEFKRRARETQRRFANEIARVGRGYFVQTPARGFPIESHTWLPLVALLPRPALLRVITAANKFWIKKTIPDFCLFGPTELKDLFPGSELLTERVAGLPKSYVALRRIARPEGG